MSRFHGTTRAQRVLGPLTLTLTEYRAESRLAAHTHTRPYASLLVSGRYTEVNCSIPKLCGSSAFIGHGASESHADYFLEPSLVLNIETDEPWSLDFVMSALRHWQPAVPQFPQPVATALQLAIRELSCRRSESKPSDRIADSASDFDWTSSRPIADIARDIGVHPTHFCRAFRQRTGLTPSAYRMRERVKSASRFMLMTEAALSRIAVDCGFSDQSHFTNAFRSATGMPPAMYRRTFGC
jgi:AraC-like DNA-binding protein